MRCQRKKISLVIEHQDVMRKSMESHSIFENFRFKTMQRLIIVYSLISTLMLFVLDFTNVIIIREFINYYERSLLFLIGKRSNDYFLFFSGSSNATRAQSLNEILFQLFVLFNDRYMLHTKGHFYFISESINRQFFFFFYAIEFHNNNGL